MNSNKTYLISRIVAAVFILIGLVLWMKIIGVTNTPTEAERLKVGTLVSYGYYLVYISFFFAIASMIFGLITNPEKIKGALIAVLGIGAVFAIAYGISDGSDFAMYNDDTVGESTSRMVSAGLNTFIILAVLAVLSVVYSSLSSFFR